MAKIDNADKMDYFLVLIRKRRNFSEMQIEHFDNITQAKTLVKLNKKMIKEDMDRDGFTNIVGQHLFYGTEIDINEIV